jgi:hypothetical protein
MAKGHLLTPEIEILIADIYEERPKRTAKEIRNAVEKRLHKQNPDLPKGWPGLSVVQKTLANLRRPKKHSRQDDLWSISTMDEFPIPLEALPKVLEEYKRHKEEGTEFTIREAKWVARLLRIQCPKIKGREEEILPYFIARTELLYELIEKPVDLQMFDNQLVGLSGEGTNSEVAFRAMFGYGGALRDDLIEKYKSKAARKRRGGTK